MNFIQIAGHLGADAETRFTPNGNKVTNLRIATNVRRGGKDETMWWKVTIWGDKFDKMLPYLKKGSAVIIYGELNKPEIYTDKDGNPQVTLTITAEVIKFSPFGKGEGQKGTGEGSSYGTQESPYAGAGYGQPQQGHNQGYGASPAQGYPYGQAAAPGASGFAAHNFSEEDDESSQLPF